MSGLETLGIVSNIFQVISFARETINLCQAVYQGRSPDDWLKDQAASLTALSAQVQQHYQGRRPQEDAERQLSILATKCGIAARSLGEEVAFLRSHEAKGNLTATLRLAVKTNWRKKRLETLERSLYAHQKTLETHLLVRVCKQSDAVELTQREAFRDLGNQLQYFVSKYASGHTTLSELVKVESLSVKDHTTKEISRAENATQSYITTKLLTVEKSITGHVNTKLEEKTRQITGNIQQLKLEAVTNVQRERLLRSLKFPAMNERQNHIVDSHEGTFEWIFKSRTAAGDSASEDDTSESGTTDTTNQSADNHEANNPAVNSRPVDDDDDGSSEDFSDDSNQPSDDSASYQHSNGTPYDLASDTDSVDLWDNFGDWLKSESRLYWISGKPGSGKSTLVKFLLSSSLTREALDVWKPNTIMLSHFFWKPGSRMQKSLKGLFCHLLYQALSEDQHALDALLSNAPSLASKEADTDWSIQELKAAFFRALASISRPFCIFIDGLDEISDEDGATALMKSIDEIESLPYIKICVASRPEPRFEKVLYNRPRLRLQDLTERDMRRYTVATLYTISHNQSWSPELRGRIFYELVSKADGVFLWLRLAIQSLIRGCENGDNGDTLLQRLQALPNDLSKLYHDMWTRVNDDIPLYRTSAALFFNLILDATDIHENILKATGEGIMSPYDDDEDCSISIFQLMAATQPIVPVTLLDKRSGFEESELSQLCEDTQTAIKLRCAGIVEIHLLSNNYNYSAWKTNCQHKGVLPYLETTIRFIHRSAYDFLKDSEDGHRLRAHDLSSQNERIILLMRAQLAQSSIFRRIPYSSIYEILIPLSWIRDPGFRGPVEQMLRCCWDWYTFKYLDFDDRRIDFASPHFLSVAACSSFGDFVISNIANSPCPSMLATEVLRDMMGTASQRWDVEMIDHWATLESFHDIAEYFLKRLVALGADPNAKGVCRAWHPGNSTLYSWPCTSISTFGYFLVESFKWPPSCLKHAPRLLSTFMDTTPDLDEGIPLAICVSDPHIWLRKGELCSDASLFRSGTVIVLYANLSYLIQALALRASGATAAHYSASNSDLTKQQDEIGKEILPKPSVQVALILLQNDDYRRVSYRPIDQESSPTLPALLRLACLWLQKDDDEDLIWHFCDQVKLVTQEIKDGTEAFVRVDEPAEVYLAKNGYGYEWVE